MIPPGPDQWLHLGLAMDSTWTRPVAPPGQRLHVDLASASTWTWPLAPPGPCNFLRPDMGIGSTWYSHLLQLDLAI